MGELVVVEVGAFEGQLGRGGHDQHRPSGPCTGTRWAALPASRYPRRCVDPGRLQQSPQIVGPVGHVGQGMGVRGGGQRDPGPTNRSRRGGAGYSSPTGFRHPADESSAAMPDRTAASVIRS